MILAAASDLTASNLGYWMIAAGLVIPAASAVLAVFITRREVESMKAESDRRHSAHEATAKDLFSKIGGVERGARANDDAIRADMRRETFELHEKINRVDKATTATEVETRQQSNILRAIAHKLNITA